MSVYIRIQVDSDTTPKYTGWRGLYEVEGGRIVPPLMPAVMPPINQVALSMTREIQWLSYLLMQYFCPTLTKKTWRALHKYNVAMNNGNQNGYDGGIPHDDYINSVDIGTSLPRYDKMQRTFQGTFIRGDLLGDTIVCRAGIHGINAAAALPTIPEIVAKNWYVVAVNAGTEQNPGGSHFAQGGGYPIVYPFIFTGEISYPAAWFEPWESDTLPDPCKIYA